MGRLFPGQENEGSVVLRDKVWAGVAAALASLGVSL